MVKLFLVSFHHLNLSHSVSLHSVWLMFPLWSLLPASNPIAVPSPRSLPPGQQISFQSGSMGDPHFGYLVLLTSYLPPPPHLPIHPPFEHMAGCMAWTRRDFNKYLGAAGIIMTRVTGWLQCAHLCAWQRDRQGRVCVHVSVCFWMTVPSPPRPERTPHVITVGVRVGAFMWRAWADGGVNLSLWQTLIIFNPGGILLKWKAAFQFYNPVDLISPPAPVQTVQLDGQDGPDESYSPQTHLHCHALAVPKH